MIKVPFHKMQGAGNDFVVIDHQPGIDYVDLAKKVCDRHMGIGADGLLVLDASATSDYRMRIINADGSEAEMCGNGARCMAVYIVRKFAVVPEFFTLETLAGTIRASAAGETAIVHLSDPREYRANIDLRVGEQKLTAQFINTGVPHTIVFVTGLGDFDVNSLGRVIRSHPAFGSRGTNVNFVENVRDGIISLRTYERGVEAETMSCGTGSVASALIGYLQTHQPLTPQKDAAMKALTKSGEILEVSFDLDVKNDKPVITNVKLKGSGRFIARGDYYYQ